MSTKFYAFQHFNTRKLLSCLDLRTENISVRVVIMQAESRVTMNVDVPRGAQRKLRDYCKQHGVIQRHLMGALIERFLVEPDEVKRVMRGDVDATMRGAYADALDHLARELRGAEQNHRQTLGVVMPENGAGGGPAASPSRRQPVGR